MKQRGFSLVELMVSIAIVGFMSAAAMPMLVKYITKSKQIEAREQVRKLYDGARVYYLDKHTPPGAVTPLPSQFPDTQALTPAVNCCIGGAIKCLPDATQWNTPSWTALAYSVDDPHYYRYGFVSSGTSTTAKFTARAVGDLDCDGVESTFMMLGSVLSGGDVSGNAQILQNLPLE